MRKTIGAGTYVTGGKLAFLFAISISSAVLLLFTFDLFFPASGTKFSAVPLATALLGNYAFSRNQGVDVWSFALANWTIIVGLMLVIGLYFPLPAPVAWAISIPAVLFACIAGPLLMVNIVRPALFK